MKPKTLLYLLVAVAIVAVVAFVAYQFISGGNSGTPAVPSQTGLLPSAQNQQFPSGGRGRISRIF